MSKKLLLILTLLNSNELLAQGTEKALEAAFMMIIMAIAFLVVSIISLIIFIRKRKLIPRIIAGIFGFIMALSSLFGALNESSSGMNDLGIIFLIIGILLIILAFFLPAKQKLET
jgi:uncharacterized membrane protein HdeD (DUF308 family)